MTKKQTNFFQGNRGRNGTWFSTNFQNRRLEHFWHDFVTAVVTSKPLYMERLTTINTFVCSRKGQSIWDEQIAKMQDLTAAYNFSEHPVKLHLFGDERSGIRFRIDCDDPGTRTRLESVLKQYKQQLSNDN